MQASDVEDLIMGVGQPAGEAGFNLGRVVAVLAGLDEVPGVTVNRYCSSSCRPSAWPPTPSARARVTASSPPASRPSAATSTAPATPPERDLRRGGRALEGPVRRWRRDLDAADRLPDMYIAMGQTAENVREVENVSREEMDQFAKLSQDRASANIANGFSSRRSPADPPGRHGRQQGRLPP